VDSCWCMDGNIHWFYVTDVDKEMAKILACDFLVWCHPGIGDGEIRYAGRILADADQQSS